MHAADRAYATVPLLITLLACSAPEQPQGERTEPAKLEAPGPSLPKSWSVTITSVGGYDRHGRAGVMVSSDGTARAMRRMSVWCGPTDLGEQDRLVIERAVADAQPQRWTQSHEGIPGVDVSFSLEIRRDEGQGEAAYQTSWRGVTEDFPADLQTLFTTGWQLRERALAACPDP